MPFKSEKQRRYLWANEPEIAREWTDRYGASQGGITRLPFWTGSIPSSRGAVDWSQAFKDSSYLPDYFWEEKEIVDDTIPQNLGDGIVGVNQVAGMTGNDNNSNSGLNFNNMSSNFFNNFKETLPGRGIRSALNFVTDNPWVAAITGGIGSMVNRYNPLKEGSQNYNPDLQGQVDILDEWGMLGDQSSPYKITSGPLAGKNLVSGFGTNDYRKMLQKRIDYFRNKKSLTESQNQKMHEAIAEEKRILEKKTRAAAAAAAGQRRAGRGGDHMSRSRDQGGLGISRSQAQAVSDANRDAGMSGWGL